MNNDDMPDISDNKTSGKMGPTLAIVILVAVLSGAVGGFLTVTFLPGAKSPEPVPIDGKKIRIQKQVLERDTTGTTEKNRPVPEDELFTSKMPNDIGLIELEKFVTNIADLYAKHYIAVELKLVISPKELVPEITKDKLLMASLRHDIHMILSTKIYKDIRSAAGKLAFFEEVQIRGNELIKEKLGKEPIVKVLHTLWQIE